MAAGAGKPQKDAILVIFRPTIALELGEKPYRFRNSHGEAKFPMKSMIQSVVALVGRWRHHWARFWAGKRTMGESCVNRMGIGAFFILPWYALSWLGGDSGLWRLAYVLFILLPLGSALAGVALHHFLKANSEGEGDFAGWDAEKGSEAPIPD